LPRGSLPGSARPLGDAQRLPSRHRAQSPALRGHPVRRRAGDRAVVAHVRPRAAVRAVGAGDRPPRRARESQPPRHQAHPARQDGARGAGRGARRARRRVQSDPQGIVGLRSPPAGGPEGMTRKEEQLRKAMLHYLEGSIHPEELEVLNRVVETDPDARREMAELMLQDALLTKVGQETEFFELDDPRPMPLPSVSSCRTSRIMKITRRAPIVEAPAPARRPSWKVAIAAAAVLFAVSVATAVLQSGSFDAVPVT